MKKQDPKAGIYLQRTKSIAAALLIVFSQAKAMAEFVSNDVTVCKKSASNLILCEENATLSITLDKERVNYYNKDANIIFDSKETVINIGYSVYTLKKMKALKNTKALTGVDSDILITFEKKNNRYTSVIFFNGVARVEVKAVKNNGEYTIDKHIYSSGADKLFRPKLHMLITGLSLLSMKEIVDW